LINHPEEPIEETFVSQMCIFRKVKYVMAFIYNAYGFWMLIRTDRRKEMYGFHQSFEGAVETKNNNSLETALRELRKETGLRIY